jgi:ketosteroid isomerase-like protein
LGWKILITREYVEKVISSVVDAADYAEFQKHVTDDFIYEFMGTQPYSGEWRGSDAVKRQFTAFNENFTTDFRVKVTELYVDAEKNTAVARLQSLPLTDLGGGDYRQHCVWFAYFNDSGKIRRLVDYSDTKLVDEMIVRVQTAKMQKLREGCSPNPARAVPRGSPRVTRSPIKGQQGFERPYAGGVTSNRQWSWVPSAWQ